MSKSLERLQTTLSFILREIEGREFSIRQHEEGIAEDQTALAELYRDQKDVEQALQLLNKSRNLRVVA